MSKDLLRTAFYQKIPQFWPDLYNEPYALYDMHMLDDERLYALREATKACGQLFFKTASLLRQLDDDTLLQMGYPVEALSFLRIEPYMSESIIARFDFVFYEGKMKVLELNSDTPTFIKELFFVNQHVCEAFRVKDINEGEEERLQRAVTAVINKAKQHIKTDTPHIVFTSHGDHVEDRYTAKYLQSLYDEESCFVPLDRLQIIEGDGLYDDKGKKIDILYRQTFPIECALLDEAQSGDPIGEWLLQLVCDRKLHIINPPSAFLLQNKAVQAIIWGLHEQNHPFFSAEEHQWIAQYFLPTYLDADYFQEKHISYVKKPVFGREGDTIEVYNEKGMKVIEEEKRTYTAYKGIYQKYVDLPTTSMNVDGQIKSLHYMYGSFFIDGEASAIGCRAGGQITNNLSYYVPLGREET
ncbi:glutathionylspermidine synthase family protein [Bacillus manliponensis]|uniref:glutathionylspermidine synthase family protein n=1 Tax=Bacillus manliponensis TaxID=574376 RepID=UPI0035160BB5